MLAEIERRRPKLADMRRTAITDLKLLIIERSEERAGRRLPMRGIPYWHVS